MKTLTIILAAALTLQVGVLFAGNINERVPAARENVSMTTVSLIPEIPAVATFEDFTMADLISLPELAPVIPTVADFNDTPEIANPDYSYLAPTTPAVADFE